MKKMISILLTVTALVSATSAFAATTSTGTVANRTANTVFATSPTDEASMPLFAPDDAVNFTISGVKNGDVITLLTYKYNSEPSNSTVQYIDQYTASGDTQDVSYIVRDIGTDIYQLKIRANGNELYTVYYKVADGGATPPAPAVLYGDVDGNGSVTPKDNVTLARYLAVWAGYDETTVDLAAADVDDNGSVTAKDNGTLARHLAGWAGYETLPKK